MRAVVTRVNSASVEIDGAVAGAIGRGLLVLLGVHEEDTEAQARRIADKICGLRIFEDAEGRINVNPVNAGAAELLIISQFTLFADCRSRRPARDRHPSLRAGDRRVPRPRLPGRDRRLRCEDAGALGQRGAFHHSAGYKGAVKNHADQDLTRGPA